MWFLAVTILVSTILLFCFLNLQKKYRWDGIFLYVSCFVPIIFVYVYLIFFISVSLSNSMFFIIVLAMLSFLFFIYWLPWKKTKKTILIYGINRNNCAEYLSNLIQNLGFSNHDISTLNRSLASTGLIEGTKPAFKVTSQNASYCFRIQFGYFTRISICATKYKIDETQIKNFKDTCWKTFEELTDNLLIAPYIIGFLCMLFFSSLLIFLPFTGSFAKLIIIHTNVPYFFLLTFPGLVFASFMVIPYGIEIDEFLKSPK